MSTPRIFALFLLLGAFLTASCAHLDTTPAPKGYKTLSGVLHIKGLEALPVDSKALVRLVDVTRPERYGTVLAEQEIGSPMGFAVPFTLDCKAEDMDYPNRVQLEARISIKGKLKYRNLNAIPITSANTEAPLDIWLEMVSR